jgi:phenylacetate-coenzyme A ligase PaaK-like adenylate-forming protein
LCFFPVIETVCIFSVDSGSIYLFFLQKCAVSAEFENSARDYLMEFVSNSKKVQMQLPTGLTAQEEFCIRQISQQLGLTVRSLERYGEKMVYILKPQPE